MIRAIHSAATPAPAPTATLLRFAGIVGSERAAALLADVTRRVDGIGLALSAALARTHAEMKAGGFVEVRAELDALRAHVEQTTRMVRQLLGAAERDARGATLVDINAIVSAAVERVRDRRGATVDLAIHLTPGLPAVPARPAALLKAVERAVAFFELGAPGNEGAITIETTTVTSALDTEPIVRVRLSGPATPPSAAPDSACEALGDAGRIVANHGGTLAVTNGAGSDLTITMDFPAV